MHKSFLEFFAAREIAQSDTKVDEFFGIDRLDYRNYEEWMRRRPLVEYLLGLLPDEKKIELMKEDGLYSANTVGKSERELWVKVLLSIQIKNRRQLLYVEWALQNMCRKIYPSDVLAKNSKKSLRDCVLAWLSFNNKPLQNLFIRHYISNSSLQFPVTNE